MRKTLLLTGPPGVGKTTVLRRVAEALPPTAIGGFFTEEIRAGGQRVGFGIQTFDGQKATLAHVALHSVHRVGRYKVDTAGLDRIVESTLPPAVSTAAYLIDEIGKMECLSPRFVAAVERLLDGRSVVVATVAQRGSGLIADVKRRADVETWEVTRANRDGLTAAVLQWLAGRGVPLRSAGPARDPGSRL
ncbi:MAG: nucleoside-triphosphatase [Candidatus Methylomirabilales bacterium]